MADGYHSKTPIVSNCAIILPRDDMRVSYLFLDCNQSLERVSLDKAVVGMLAAILTEAIAKKNLFLTFNNMVGVTCKPIIEIKLSFELSLKL